MTMATPAAPSRHDVTRILDGADGLTREHVFARLAPIVYDELRVLAAAQLRGERSDHSLQSTALVNEAYLGLVGTHHPPWEDRAEPERSRLLDDLCGEDEALRARVRVPLVAEPLLSARRGVGDGAPAISPG